MTSDYFDQEALARVIGQVPADGGPNDRRPLNLRIASAVITAGLMPIDGHDEAVRAGVLEDISREMRASAHARGMEIKQPAVVPQNERINGSLWLTDDERIAALWADFVIEDMKFPGASFPTAKDGFYYAHRHLAPAVEALETAEEKIAVHNAKHTAAYVSESDETWERNAVCSCGRGAYPCQEII